MHKEEIEIKLHLPPEQASTFRRSSVLRDHKLARASTARLLSTYFDTPKLHLHERGMALRIRQMGRVREQTLKWSNPAGTGLQTRSEFNDMIEGDSPDLDIVADDTVKKWFEKQGVAKDLLPVFETDFKRTKWPIHYNGAHIEVALDEGELRSKGTVSPISEIELELVDGDPVAMIDLAMTLSKRLDVSLDHGSKAARGYELFQGAEQGPVKAVDPVLDKNMSVWQAFNAFMTSGLRQLMANAPVVLRGDDPEGVHQARVAVRRMRAALSLFKPLLAEGPQMKARHELRWLQQELGPARDWDVFIEETLMPLRRHSSANGALESLAESAESARAAGYERAVAAVRSRRFTAILLWLEKWLVEGEADCLTDQSLLQFSKGVLDKRRKRALKKAGKDLTALPEERLHALRIELKKLRYASSFFKSLYSKSRSKDFLKAMSSLQDCLGGLNDAAVQRGLLATLEEQGRPADDRAIAMLAGWHAAHVDTGLSKLAKLWKGFAGTKPFWQ